MLKRIAAFFVLLTMMFAFQGNVWAAAANAGDAMAGQQTEVIALAENPQLAALNEDIQLLGATGFGGMKIEPWFWVLSIPIAGLGSSWRQWCSPLPDPFWQACSWRREPAGPCTASLR
jgi:hypothetical protein